LPNLRSQFRKLSRRKDCEQIGPIAAPHLGPLLSEERHQFSNYANESFLLITGCKSKSRRLIGAGAQKLSGDKHH